MLEKWHMDKYAPSIIKVSMKYGEPRLYCNGEIDLITKT
jgi:hypothetical protein